MSFTRRSFLKIAVIFAGSLITTYVALKRITPLRNLYVKFVAPELKESPVGTINEHVVNTLLAATENVTEYSIEKEHYKDYFRWRAENLKGYKKLYEQFTSSVDNVTNNSYNQDFIKCSKSEQHIIIKSIRPAGNFDKLIKKLFKENWLIAERHIFGEILLLFAFTDTWVAIGYESWPGIPRGLSKYTQPPKFLKRAQND